MVEMQKVLDKLSQETGDFWSDFEVKVLDSPTTVEFLCEAYSKYHPVIIRGGTTNWTAINSWNKDYLINASHDKLLNINLTADGHGDCVKTVSDIDIVMDDCHTKVPHDISNDEYFVYPAECNMTLKDFFTVMEQQQNDNSNCNIVPYLSQQNDNLRTSLPCLLNDIGPLTFAEESFGVSEPEAVNLWIGDERSVSSIHKDHYENMYAVISGEKVFTLLPPTDVAFLPENTYKTLKYQLKSQTEADNNNSNNNDSDIMSTVSPPTMSAVDLNNDRLVLVPTDCPSSSLRWIPLDTEDPEVCTKYPNYSKAHPIRCVVRPGEILYIPAMWYHRVTQSTLTIAVNYWYDQRFDFRFVFYQTMRAAAIAMGTTASDDVELELEEND